MTERVPCIIRPGEKLSRRQSNFTLYVPGGGPLRFSRPTVMERKAVLDPQQIAAVREAGYEVETPSPPKAGNPCVGVGSGPFSLPSPAW